MNFIQEAPDTDLRGKAPYTGLRPYEESERHLFFGRDQDARRLRNKIFSAPLTLLYAPSGVGKTSLLRALIIPELRSHGANVIYYDRWSEDDPLDAIKKLIAEIIPGEEIEGRTLLEVIQDLSEDSDNPIVLILDQFEEYLVRHAAHLDPLRSELADLVRAEADAYVLLSLREEFLASLDTFRSQILKLHQSRFRLDHLNYEKACVAITEPARLFGVECEPELVGLLLTDLKAEISSDEGAIAAEISEGIELPFLQIVCERLWYEFRRRNHRSLTLDLYKELGGKRGILEKFLNQVTDSLSKRSQQRAAVILKFLAPPSGLKMAYTVKDLKEPTDLEEHDLVQLLEHFDKSRIVRIRETSRGKSYELFHDAFIKVLRPWVSRQLIKERRGRVLRSLAVAASALTVIVIFCTFWITSFLKEEQRVRGQMRKIETINMSNSSSPSEQIESIVDNVSSYLWSKDKVEELIQIMKEFESHIPADYGHDRRAPDLMPFVSDQEEWPLVLVVNQRRVTSEIAENSVSRDLKESQSNIQFYWRFFATSLSRVLGVPMPMRIKLEYDDAIARDRIILKYRDGAVSEASDGENSINMIGMNVLYRPSEIIIRQEDIDSRLQFFFQQNQDKWSSFSTENFYSGTWWSVPKWTHPLWRSSGQDVYPKEAAIVVLLLEEIMQRPELVVSRGAVEQLLRRAGESYPKTVEQAIRSRGGVEETREVFIEIFRRNGSLRHLVYILDTVAKYPDQPAALAAWSVLLEMQSLEEEFPERFPGHFFTNEEFEPSLLESDRFPYVYEEASRWLPNLRDTDSPIRVKLGADIVPGIVVDNDLTKEFQEGMSTLRGEIYKRCSIEPPGVQFVGFSTGLKGNEIQVEVIGKAVQSAFWNREEKVAKFIIEELYKQYLDACTWWFTADRVQAILEEAPEKLREWLENEYTNTDLKLIMKSTLNDGLREGQRSLPVLRTLESLIFWRQIGDPQSFPSTVANIERISEAADLGGGGAGDRSAELVRDGIVEISHGNYSVAEDLFSQAVRRNEESAVQAYLLAFHQYAYNGNMEELRNLCMIPEIRYIEKLDSDDFAIAHRYRLEQFVEDNPEIYSRDMLKFNICLMEHYLANGHRSIFEKTADHLESHEGDFDWRSEEKFVVAYRLLESHDSFDTPPERLDWIVSLLAGAFRVFDTEESMIAFDKIWPYAFFKKLAPHWYLSVLYELVEARPDSYTMPMMVANYLGMSSSVEDAEMRLRMLDIAEKNIKKAASELGF